MSYNDDDEKEINLEVLEEDDLPDDGLVEPPLDDDLVDDDVLDDTFAGLDGSEY